LGGSVDEKALVASATPLIALCATRDSNDLFKQTLLQRDSDPSRANQIALRITALHQ
jgi:hypothetical protein